MSSSIWRPRQSIRAISIGIFSRGSEILVCRVTDDAGEVVGWRPPGGAIEFGETAEAALHREMREETGCDIEVSARLAVLENIYRHEGETGHEIVFVFAGSFKHQPVYGAAHFDFIDDGLAVHARWLPLRAFQDGLARLLPEGLMSACLIGFSAAESGGPKLNQE